MTLRETALVLNEGITISGRSLAEHLQIIDNDKGYRLMLEYVESDTPLTADVIKGIHRVVGYNEPSAAPAGEYATHQRTVGGSLAWPPPPPLVPPLVEALVAALPEQLSLPDIAQFHLILEDIHPFNDANGRTGRLILNLMLMRTGYPPVNIKADDASVEQYYSAFDAFMSKGRDATPMLRLLADLVARRLDQYLAVIQPGSSL